MRYLLPSFLLGLGLTACQGGPGFEVGPSPCATVVVARGVPTDVPSSVGLVPDEVLAELNAMTDVVIDPRHDLGAPLETTAAVDLVLLEAAEAVVEPNPESSVECLAEEQGARLLLLLQGTYEVAGWGSAAGTSAVHVDATGQPTRVQGELVADLEPGLDEDLADSLDRGCDPEDLTFRSRITPDGISFSYDARCDGSTFGALFDATPSAP